MVQNSTKMIDDSIGNQHFENLWFCKRFMNVHVSSLGFNVLVPGDGTPSYVNAFVQHVSSRVGEPSFVKVLV